LLMRWAEGSIYTSNEIERFEELYMVLVSSRYNPELAEYIKSVGGRWNPEIKAWDVPEDAYDDVKYKAMELGITLETPAQKIGRAGVKVSPGTGGEVPAQSRPDSQKNMQGTIRLRRSRDGRFVMVNINLIAFSEDVEKLLKGEVNSVRFRVMRPRPKQT
jgi:hypothetical protein